MSHYIQQLKAETKDDQDRRAEQTKLTRDAEASAARERLTPLDSRLQQLLASIPVVVQSEGLSLPALQTLLKGRWRGTCHPGELGKALRRLGWARKRCWRSGVDGAGFAARWHPPA